MQTRTATRISLEPYAGPWDRARAAHFLRRATYAPTLEEINRAVRLGMKETLRKVLEATPPSDGPRYYDFDGHPDAKVGQEWAGLYYVENPDDDRISEDSNARGRSLRRWYLLTLLEGGFSIQSKMMTFWLNHFGMKPPGENNIRYYSFRRFQQFAVGNFRELVKEITIDPSMLAFLNGNQSTKGNPNENFAREILELYTVGKGPQIPGSEPADYTNYTELDVAELAKAFTGWRTRNFYSRDPEKKAEAYFQANRHDETTKTLSHRFNNATIDNAGEREYANVVDLIFQQDECARFICRKLYRYFVYYRITDEVEDSIITPLANVLIENDYRIGAALEVLFASEHFYEERVIGSLIKNPLEFVVSLARTGQWLKGAGDDTYQRYRRAQILDGTARTLGMDVYAPPSVSGWPAYYQAPDFFRLWLNSPTLQERTRFQNRVTRGRFSWDRQRYTFDWLALLEDFADPFDALTMIEEFAERLLPRPLNGTQLQALRDLLLPDLQDFVWSSEYGLYQANPGDEMLRRAVESRLQQMLYGMTQLAEFQLN